MALNSLVVHEVTSSPNDSSDAAIVILAFVLVESLGNFCLQYRVLINGLLHLLLTLKSAKDQAAQYQKAFKRVLLPQFNHDFPFFRYVACSFA